MQCLPCLIIFTEISTSITFRLFFTFIGTDPNVLITTRSTFVTSSHFSNLSHKILLNFLIFLFSHPSILWNIATYIIWQFLSVFLMNTIIIIIISISSSSSISIIIKFTMLIKFSTFLPRYPYCWLVPGETLIIHPMIYWFVETSFWCCMQPLRAALQVKVFAWSPFGDQWRLFYKSSCQLQNFRRHGD